MSQQFPARRGYVSVAIEKDLVQVTLENEFGDADEWRCVSTRVALDLGKAITRAAKEIIAAKAQATP